MKPENQVRFLLVGFILFAVLISMTGPKDFLKGPKKLDPSIQKATYESIIENSIQNAVTIRNRTYIPLWIEGEPGDFAEKILELIAEFETKNGVQVLGYPDFDVHYSTFSPPQFRGLWLVHKPKIKV